MIKTLRTPTVFCLLTLVLAGWFTAWHISEKNSGYKPYSSTHRPLYQLSQRIPTRPPQGSLSNSYQRQACGERVVCAAKTKHGICYGPIVRKDGTWTTERHGAVVLAAGSPAYQLVEREFGLYTRVLESRSHALVVRHIGSLPPLSFEESTGTTGVSTSLVSLQFPNIQKTNTIWSVHPTALLHDATFLIVLIAYLVSIAGIPRWLIWKRLTRAQRKRAKHQCPRCAYELAGLNSTTCPECGHNPLNPA